MDVFIQYKSYRTHSLYPSQSFPWMNEHWDCTCRPDPDYSTIYPSTGLCRSPSIQNFIYKHRNNIKNVYYFYRYMDRGTKCIAIPAILKYHDSSITHSVAFNWYQSRHLTPPPNVVADSQQNYRKCLVPIHNVQTDFGYYKRQYNRYIHFEWVKNRLGHPIELSESSFLQCMSFMKATLTNLSTPFNKFQQLRNTAIVIP